VATQRERSERTVAALVSAGRSLMSEHGYHAVTVDAMAAQAGVAKGAFYHHFPSKQALLDAVVDSLQGEIADELRARRRPYPLSAIDLAEVLEDYLRRAASDRRRRLVLIEGPEVLGWTRWREIDDSHFAGMTRAALAMIMPAGTEDARIEIATRLVLGAVMEAALATGRASNRGEVAAQFGNVLRDLLTGLAGGTDERRAH
jgi:AcrR family transcriptional regulator